MKPISLDLARNKGIQSEFKAKDLSKYRSGVLDWIQAQAEGKKAFNIATEVSTDARLRDGASLLDSDQGLLVSFDALMANRGLSENVYGAGGALVGDEMAKPADALRNVSRLGQAGATILTGLQGNYTLPLGVSDITLSWLASGASITPTNITTGAFSMSPNRLAGALNWSFQLDTQSPDAGAFFADMIANAAMAKIDQAGLSGSGVSGEPLGILNQAGTNAVDFGGVAATLAKATTFESQIAAANGVPENTRFIANGDVKARWSQIQRWTGASVALWSDDDTILGRKAYTTTGMTSGRIVAGDFSKFLVGVWGAGGPMRLLVNKYTNALQGQISLTVEMLADVGAYKPACFSVSTSSAIL